MWWLKVLLCAYAIVISAGEEDETESRVVRTSQGPVRGYRAPEGLFTFYGIPYATAPSGPNKFKAPLPAPLWLETLEAVNKDIVCPQIPLLPTNLVQEDCLVANVYVPDTEDTNLPVVVYVHGGAFQIGYGNLLTPKNLVMSQNVIVVTFNYRLGVHGFLCLGTPDVPGNAGMKDQVAALRWIKKNIANFGGNPNDITIAGYSAGSSSVDLLLISDTTKDLFNKLIAESGSNLGPAVVIDPLKNAKTYAKSMNFSEVDDIYTLEEFYKTASFDLLTKGAMMDRTDCTLLFSPCVERDTDEEEFLKEAPTTLLKKGKFRKIPMLYGISNMEGLFRLPYFDFWKNKMNEKFSDFLPGDLAFENEEEKEAVASKVKEFYFGDKPIGEETILKYIDYFSDVIFAYPMLRAMKMYVEAGHEQIYLYEYSFVDDHTPPVPHANVRGAAHCAQSGAVLDGKALGNPDESEISEEYIIMKKVMRELWANFAKTGTPVPAGSDLPTWPATGANGAPYMSLTQPLELQQEALLPQRVLFWEELYDQYYRVPIPPPTPPPRHTEL